MYQRVVCVVVVVGVVGVVGGGGGWFFFIRPTFLDCLLYTRESSEINVHLTFLIYTKDPFVEIIRACDMVPVDSIPVCHSHLMSMTYFRPIQSCGRVCTPQWWMDIHQHHQPTTKR